LKKDKYMNRVERYKKKLLTIPGGSVDETISFLRNFSSRKGDEGKVLVGECPVRKGQVGLVCPDIDKDKPMRGRCVSRQETFESIKQRINDHFLKMGAKVVVSKENPPNYVDGMVQLTVPQKGFKITVAQGAGGGVSDKWFKGPYCMAIDGNIGEKGFPFIDSKK